jgi:hypothetical protein
VQVDDRPMFVNTLRNTSAFAYRTKLESLNLKPPEQSTIQANLNESIDNPRHFEKVRWFAEYWNRSVPYGGNDFSTITTACRARPCAVGWCGI